MNAINIPNLQVFFYLLLLINYAYIPKKKSLKIFHLSNKIILLNVIAYIFEQILSLTIEKIISTALLCSLIVSMCRLNFIKN